MKIRYYVTRKWKGRTPRGFWAPCLARPNKKTGVFEPTLMAKLGFEHIDCGEDGPRAWAIAESWNAKWDQMRADHAAGKVDLSAKKFERVYPVNSVGEGFARLRRTGVWAAKKPRTREDWMRGWKYIEPIFADVDPRTLSMDDLALWYMGDPAAPTIKGLLQTISVREAYRAMKIWRALWKVIATINRPDGQRYVISQDPSLGIRRQTPKPRDVYWFEGQAVRLVKGAWRHGYKGLAVALAVAWDTMLSPIDVRSLTLSQLTPDPKGPLFALERTKTGRDAIGTLSKRTEKLLAAYLASLPFTLHPETPIFHTRGAKPGPRGGKPRPPVPYTKDTLGDDFREIRNLVFKGDKRQLQDFRRSGAIEATAGKVDPAALAGKMANTIDSNRELQRTYTPHNATLVRLADEARARGRTLMRDASGAQKGGKR